MTAGPLPLPPPPPPPDAPLPPACPQCGQPAEVGFICYEAHRAWWMRAQPEHVWQLKVGDTFGSGSVSQAGMIYAPGTRCRACRVVMFRYPP